MYNNVNYKIQGDQISTDLEGQLQQTNDLIFLEPHPAMCHLQYCKQFKSCMDDTTLRVRDDLSVLRSCALHYMHDSTYALPLM